MSATRQRHRQHGNPFNVRHAVAPPDWAAVYGREAPLALDIGCGPGRFAVELARHHSEWNVLGLEIRQHLVDELLARAAAEGLRNLYGLLANANLHLADLVRPLSVAFVSINFPDPWFKKRHHKRRVVRSDWLELLATRLVPGAEVHVMTDNEPLALEIRGLLENEPALANTLGPARFAPESTTGIASEREMTHLRRGDPVFRLCYRRLALTPRGTPSPSPAPAEKV